MKKKYLSICLTVLMICTLMFSVPATANAADFTNEPIIYGIDYYTGYVGQDEVVDYKLVVPATGTITITGYYEKFGRSVCVQIIDPEKVKPIYSEYLHGRDNSVALQEFKFTLEAGEYCLRINSIDRFTCGDYGFKVDYNFDSATKAKVTSPGTGKMKITAPKGSNVDGFEIRYKVSGASKWTYKKVEGNKTLNTIIKNLKSGKKYIVQTRKYVHDSYDYKYTSSWTKAQSVTIK